MWGRATLVTVTSRTCITVTSITAPVIVHFRVADSGSSAGTAEAIVATGHQYRLVAEHDDPRTVMNREPETFRIDPEVVRQHRPVALLLGGVALLVLLLPLLADGVRVAWALHVLGAVGFLVFGGAAYHSLRVARRAPAQAVTIDGDGLWPATMPKERGLVRWPAVRGFRERY